jgi:hypothetical protein
MKKLLILAIVIALCGLNLFAQSQAETYINEALGYVKTKNYKQAQLSLQDAMNDLSALVGKEALATLPVEINGLKANPNNDNTNSAGMGMMGGGMTLSRKYEGNNSSAQVDIISNSPLISMVSGMLSNPYMMSGDKNQKSVRVGTRRGILKTEKNESSDDNGTTTTSQSFELQLIIGQTLATIKGENFKDEATFTAFYSKIDFDKLAKALGEQ